MPNVGQGFRAFRHPNYRLYFVGQSISLIGTWMQTVAQAWLVIQNLHGSPTDLGIVSALQFLPIIVVGSYGGVIADRLPKRELLVLTQIGQMVPAFVLGVLVSTHLVQIWQVYLLAAVLGVAAAFDTEMVGPEDLMNGIAFNTMTFNGARIVGPAIAGVLIGIVGVTSSFYINGISFLFVIAGLLLMRKDRFFAVERAPRASLGRSLAEGFGYMRRSPAPLLITIVVGVLGLFAFNNQVLIPLFAVNVLNVGSTGYGVLYAATGIGSLTAAMIAAFAQRATWWRIFGGAIGITLTEIAFSFSRSYPLSIVLGVLMGLAMHTFFTSANTAVQQRVPDRLRGRVMGVYMTANMGTMPIGNLMCGPVAGAFGAPFAMTAGALLALTGLSGLAGWMALNRARLDFRIAPDAPDTPAAAAVHGQAVNGALAADARPELPAGRAGS